MDLYRPFDLPESAEPYKQLLKEAGVKFYYDVKSSANDQSTCKQSIDDFFKYVREDHARDNKFKEMLQNSFRTGANGGLKGNPQKNIVMGNLSEEDPQIRNHRDKFFWRGGSEVLFRTFQELASANLSPSGFHKHFPVTPDSNNSYPTMQTELKEYLRRYGGTISPEQKMAIGAAINQPEDDTKIPLTLRSYWYKISQNIPDDCIRAMAQSLKNCASDQWRCCISTNDIPAQKQEVERFKRENPDLAYWAGKIEFDSLTDYYNGPDIDADLKDQLARARQTDTECSSPNPQAVSDRERILLLLGTQEQNIRKEAGGLYADVDTNMVDVPAHIMKAPLGVQVAVIPTNKFEPANTNQIIAANGSPTAKKLLLSALGRMLKGYGKNPDLNALVREPLNSVNPSSPDLDTLKSLRATAGPKSLRELLTRVIQRETLDSSVVKHVNDHPSSRRALTLLRGNQLLAVTAEMFGQHIFYQAPTAACGIGRLWQAGKINPFMEENWSGAKKRITPTNAPESRNGSSISLATYVASPTINSPRTPYLYRKTQQMLVPSSSKRDKDKSKNIVSSSLVEGQTPGVNTQQGMEQDERAPLLQRDPSQSTETSAPTRGAIARLAGLGGRVRDVVMSYTL